MFPFRIPFCRTVTTASITMTLGLSISLSAAQKTNDDTSSSYVTTTIWAPEDYDGPGPGRYNTYASVIAADATATTYQLDCVPGGIGKGDFAKVPIDFFTGCSAWPSVTLTVGASTAEIVASNGGEFHMTRGVACKVDAPASHAQCDFILDGRGAEAMAKTGRWPMDPITASEFLLYSQAVTITAGAEKIRAVDGNQSASPIPAPTASGVGGGVGEGPTGTIAAPAQGEPTITSTAAAGGSTSTSGVDHSRRNRLGLGTVMVGAAAVFFGTSLL